MDTHRLIDALALDHAKPSPSLAGALAAALLLAAPVAGLLFGMGFGMRPDISTAAGTSIFLLKISLTASLAVAGGLIALRLARPNASVMAVAWTLAIPLALLVITLVVDLYQPHQRVWTERLMGGHSLFCSLSILLLGLPFLTGALVGLRNGASVHPTCTGAFAGMLSGALGAFIYATHCNDDTPISVVFWYAVGIGAAMLVGGLLGRRILRF